MPSPSAPRRTEHRALIGEATTTEETSACADVMSRGIRRRILAADQQPNRIARIRTMAIASDDAVRGYALADLRRRTLTIMSQIVDDAPRRNVA